MSDLLEKLRIDQIIKKISAFYESLWFITVFVRACLGSYCKFINDAFIKVVH